jgi:hypothetical protein
VLPLPPAASFLPHGRRPLTPGVLPHACTASPPHRARINAPATHPHATSPLPLPKPPPHRSSLRLNGRRPPTPPPPPCAPLPFLLHPIKGAPDPLLLPHHLLALSSPRSIAAPGARHRSPPRRPDLLRRRLFLGSELPGESLLLSSSIQYFPHRKWCMGGPFGHRQ